MQSLYYEVIPGETIELDTPEKVRKFRKKFGEDIELYTAKELQNRREQEQKEPDERFGEESVNLGGSNDIVANELIRGFQDAFNREVYHPLQSLAKSVIAFPGGLFPRTKENVMMKTNRTPLQIVNDVGTDIGTHGMYALGPTGIVMRGAEAVAPTVFTNAGKAANFIKNMLPTSPAKVAEKVGALGRSGAQMAGDVGIVDAMQIAADAANNRRPPLYTIKPEDIPAHAGLGALAGVILRAPAEQQRAASQALFDQLSRNATTQKFLNAAHITRDNLGHLLRKYNTDPFIRDGATPTAAATNWLNETLAKIYSETSQLRGIPIGQQLHTINNADMTTTEAALKFPKDAFVKLMTGDAPSDKAGTAISDWAKRNRNWLDFHDAVNNQPEVAQMFDRALSMEEFYRMRHAMTNTEAAPGSLAQEKAYNAEDISARKLDEMIETLQQNVTRDTKAANSKLRQTQANILLNDRGEAGSAYDMSRLLGQIPRTEKTGRGLEAGIPAALKDAVFKNYDKYSPRSLLNAFNNPSWLPEDLAAHGLAAPIDTAGPLPIDLGAGIHRNYQDTTSNDTTTFKWKGIHRNLPYRKPDNDKHPTK